MKYIYLSILILFVISLLSGCERKPEGPVVVKVNNREITATEFREEVDKSLAIDPKFKDTPKNREKLVDELITRELLIQEAMRKDIDREAEFRRHMRVYYEQTLIEELVRWKLGAIPVDVTEEEIKARYGLMGKIHHLDIAEFDVARGDDECPRTGDDLWRLANSAVCRNCHEVSLSSDMEVMLEYLPVDFSNAVRDLKPGEVTGPLPLGEKSCFVKLGEVESISLPPYPEVRDQIRAQIEKEKKAERMEQWIRDLREKADVEVDSELLDLRR